MPRIFKERGITAPSVLARENVVLFSDADSKEFIPEKLDAIVKRAEGHLEAQIPLLPLSVFLQYRDIGDFNNYIGIHSKRRTMAFELALAEAYERKGRFTMKLADVLWAIMEESTWMIPPHMHCSPTHAEYFIPPVYDDSRIHGIDLFSAATSGTLTYVYSALKNELDAISPIICEKMKYMLIDRTIKPYLNCTFGWTGERGNSINNWCPWITADILHTMAMIVDDPYTRSKVVAKALDSLDNFTAGYQADGGCSEGPGYWGAAGASYFDCLELLADITGGEINVYDHPLLKNMFEYIVKFNINGVRFINFADCSPRTHHDGAMIRRMGQKCNSPTLCSFGDTMAMISDGAGYRHVYRGLRNLITPTPTECTNKADTRIWFPDLKVMVARESEDPSKGIFVAMKGGSNGEHHNHNDVGNVVVYYNSNPVFIDTGAGTYQKTLFSPKRYTLWYTQSNYHNLPAFGGVAQKDGIAFASSDEVYNESTGGVKMQLKGAYLPCAQLVSFTREVFLDENATVHIIDEVELEEAKEMDFRYMTCAKPELIEKGKIALVEGRTMTYDADELECEIEEFAVNDDGIQRTWKSEVLWRIHFKKTAKNGRFEFTVK